MTHDGQPPKHPARPRHIPRHLACLAALLCLAAQLTPSQVRAQGKCTAVRARREWRALSEAEQKRFLDAVKKLQQRPAPGKPSKYDLLVKVRGDLGKTMTGLYAPYLPWHRHYLLLFERELQAVDPTLTLPYWDWGFDSQAPDLAPVWGDSDFGSTGQAPSFCVTNGAFKNFQPMYPNPSCLTRSWSGGDQIGSFEGNDTLNNILTRTKGQYDTMRQTLLGRPVGLVHNNIGGAMKTMYAPNDPIYFLHMANVDRLWATWQALDPLNKTQYSGRKVDGTVVSIEDVLPGFTPSVTVKSVLSTQALCYAYQDLPIDRARPSRSR